MKKICSVVALALSFLTIASAAGITNGSFEQPTTSTFAYDPIDPTLAWTFLGRAGVASNTFFQLPAPNGTQVGFIQQYVDQTGANLSSISQNLTGLTLTPMVLTFAIATRPGYLADPIVVTYGSQNLGTFTPANTTFNTVTINFLPTTTSGTLTFKSAALTNGDLNTAIDNVNLVSGSSVPEPTSLLLVMPAIGGLLFFRRRRVA